MDKKRMKFDSFFQINDLLDECLEEIFIKLSGHDQLRARFVCSRWNRLLCDSPRLLQKSVGISLDFTGADAAERNFKVLPIVEMNPALKIYKVTIAGGIFQQLSLIPTEVIEPLQYLQPFSFCSCEELNFSCIRDNRNFQILNVLMRKMPKLKTIKMKLYAMAVPERVLSNSKLDGATYPSVEKLVIDHAYEHPIRFWSFTIFKNIEFLCERFPNLRSIVGVPGYNELFYECYAHLIESPVLEISEETQRILLKTGFHLNEIHLYQDLSQEFDSTTFWQYLNENLKSIDTIKLVYDDSGIDYDTGDRITLPNVNYSKVKHLKLHYGITELMENTENLEKTLIHFPNLITLELRCYIHGTHFYGHEKVTFKSLKNATIYLYNCVWSCDKCLEIMMSSLETIESLRMSAFDPNIVQSIGRCIPGIKELYFEWPMQEQEEDFYLSWPKMEKLERLVIPGQQINEITSIVHFCEMCPNMRQLELYLSEPFAEEISQILLKKLKFLEFIRFKGQKHLVVIKGGRTCFALESRFNN